MKKGFSEFKRVSTFTYVGRNSGLYRRILGKNPMVEEIKRNIFIVGPGPFEPFYASAMKRTSVTAIDSSAKVCSMIEKAKSGRPLELSEVAKECTNINNDGSPRPNMDLVARERIEQGRRELAENGFDSKDFISQFSLRVKNGNGNIDVVNQDVRDFVANAQSDYDAGFMCTVFINLRKSLEPSEIARIFIGLESSLCIANSPERGIFAMSTTPAGLHGKENAVSYLTESGFKITEIIVDNLVNAGGSLRGGYGIVSRKEGPMQELPSLNDGLDKALQIPIIKASEPTVETMPEASFVEFLTSTERVVIFAVRRFNPKKSLTICTVDKEKLIGNLPQTRTSFGLLR